MAVAALGLAHGKLLLYFDNLESLQNPANQRLTDDRISAWIKAAQTLTAQGLILLLTSRWQLPGWPNADHLALSHANYGDFLQMAHRLLPLALLRRRPWLRQLYRTLHGNGRGLLFFAAAMQGMDSQAEGVFLAKLAQASAETQGDMALFEIVQHLPVAAASLLQRLPAYHSPVPLEGIVKLALPLPDPAAQLQRLLAVSLVETAFAHDLQTDEFQLSPLVAEWLRQQGVPSPDLALLRQAADYQHYLFSHERSTLTQAMITHAALRRAEEIAAADQVALNSIVGPLNRQGMYRTLLDDWLPSICQSSDRQVQGDAVGQTGKQLLHIGDYETALRYLEQSLKIRQEIGDVAGLCYTLFNMGHIHAQNEDMQAAVGAWVTVYRLAQPRQLAQVLQALAELAPQLGLPAGLAGWQQLSEQMTSG